MPGNKPSDGLTRFLASLGGIPALILIIVGVLTLLALSAIGVGIAEAVAAKLGGFIDQRDALVAFAVVCALLAVFLVVAPVCRYVMIGQARRLEVIKGYYTPNIIARYFDQFWAGRDGFVDLIDRWKNRVKLDADADTNPPMINGKQLTIVDVRDIRLARQQLDDALRKKFDELLTNDFGFSMYLIPLVLLVAIAGIVMYFGFLGGISLAKACTDKGCGAANPIAIPLFGLKLDLVSIAAIFGAYTWVASDSITRNYQSNFHSSDLAWYALRFVVAVPLGEAISMLSLVQSTDFTKTSGAVVPGAWGAFLAFVISMFSFDAITKYLTAAANRVTGGSGGSPAERDDLIVRLPGVDEETARRLTAEGVGTIAEMVSVDPVRVSIRSGLSFDFILALVDAAILWTYVGGKIAILREFGFKGASNVLLYYEITRVKTTRAADLARLANAFASSDDAAKKAYATRGTAQAKLQDRQSAHDNRVAVEKRLPEIATRLQDATTGNAERTALTKEQADLQGSLAPMAPLATLSAELDTAKRNFDEADTKYTEAAKAADVANADLEAAAKNTDALLADLADKASMKASGISNIIQQLTRDQYADFILRLMSVLPVARS